MYPKGESQEPLSTLIPHTVDQILTWKSPLWTLKKEEKPNKQNRNFRPKGEGRSGRRPLLPKRKLNILVDLT